LKSFALLRTNVGLTTNLKIMISSDYKLSLDSIDSNSELSIDKYKKVSFNKRNFYDELIPYFYKGLPSEIAFQVKYNNDVDTMSDDFSDQYDEIYNYGARNILNNKNYSEEFEYFAPLYINRKKLPTNFVIFRVDGPGLGIISKENFKQEVLKNFKTVKIFDLTENTAIGEWLDINFTNNDYFPPTPLEMDFRELEFCKWNGIDYKTGGYTSKSLFIDDILDEEKEIYGLEKFIYDNYKINEIVFPNILNLTFLFDDEPSTPEVKRKWSLNRYFGFYLDEMEIVQTMSPYITPFLKDDVVIEEGNILSSQLDPENPFLLNWSESRPFYIEYKGEYYIVEKIVESQGISIQETQLDNNLVNEQYSQVLVSKFKIISDLDLSGKENDINKNYGTIDSNNKLIDYNNDSLIIESFDEADVWLIEIDGVYHNLVKNENDEVVVLSDYSFKFNQNTFEYKVAGETKSVNFLVDFNNTPKKFNIFRLKFTDIKDFDTKIIDTEFSKYEYEKKEELTLTDETKMYLEDLLSNSNPKDLDDYVYDSEVVNIPTSSEYTTNYETFKIENNDLSDIWRLNSVYCRWSYQNSLSTNDYPYVLNNSLLFESYNRTVNPFDPDPKRIERNLDYFYSINSSTSSYIHHSLHIEKLNNGEIDTNFRFELDKYLNIATYSVGTSSATYSFDYFSYFFDRLAEFDSGNIKNNVSKYSEFNIGDNIIPNISLFKGIEFRIYDVESVVLDTSGNINNINLLTNNTFEDYKLSVLLSDTNSNQMVWEIIDDWKMDQIYSTNSVVIFDDILYTATSEVITTNPIELINSIQVKSAPYNQADWTPSSNGIFWSPIDPYSIGDVVFNSDEYYYLSATAGDDFWNPIIANDTGYSINDIVLYKGDYYMSMTSSNYYDPSVKFLKNKSYWEKTNNYNKKWKTIELWNPSKIYDQPDYLNIKLVYHNGVVWTGILNTIIDQGLEPGDDPSWIRYYSLEPDTDYIYSDTDNPIISMNNKYYLCVENPSEDTLDNGIVIYINKKWKNILININISDNTFHNISEVDRDILYTDLYKKLTAYNFISAINDISNKYGFTDYLNYVIIEENGEINRFSIDDDIKNLPYLIKCEFPDEFSVKVNSLTKTPILLPSELKLSRFLYDGRIDDISKLNWYNKIPIAANIVENEFQPKVFENYSGNKNIVADTIYRFSGYYMPLFYDIDLFKKATDLEKVGNYKFDTSLTDFGIIKERKIRKVNLKESILRLIEKDDIKSIYPMVDEFGYTTTDFFIFKSTWDYEYHIESVFVNISNTRFENVESNVKTPINLINIGKPIVTQNKII
jgi:hypothetical protein